ncbi:hypothetical protein [Clostridium luticellarii]|uniref:Uncharacterized protein n=1 Tax=Clostridium luticellarii TaxID=1691940 RepID=A0A2T0BNR3_9CLOT|nr:hypothetical protein [Clostridium luticellarii]PRR85503.1 hypothetical protein CLLU_14240 [Clostridium luticellarii]
MKEIMKRLGVDCAEVDFNLNSVCYYFMKVNHKVIENNVNKLLEVKMKDDNTTFYAICLKYFEGSAFVTLAVPDSAGEGIHTDDIWLDSKYIEMTDMSDLITEKSIDADALAKEVIEKSNEILK